MQSLKQIIIFNILKMYINVRMGKFLNFNLKRELYSLADAWFAMWTHLSFQGSIFFKLRSKKPTIYSQIHLGSHITWTSQKLP